MTSIGDSPWDATLMEIDEKILALIAEYIHPDYELDKDPDRSETLVIFVCT